MGELDDKDIAPNAESTPTTHEHQTNDEPKETEKLLGGKEDENNATNKKLNSPKTPSPTTPKIVPSNPINNDKIIVNKKQNGEEIVNIPENIGSLPLSPPSLPTPPTLASSNDAKANETESTNQVVPSKPVRIDNKQDGREVKPKKIPIGGIKMPGFFTKNKPKEDGDGTGEDGELLEKKPEEKEINVNAGDVEANKPQPTVAEKSKRPNFFTNFRIRNPFAKQPLAPVDSEVNINGENDDVKHEEGTNGSVKPPAELENSTTQKKGLLNAIRLPIANIIPKKLRSVNGSGTEDVELGHGGGPNNKAGLASMETLDDSLKDTENGKDQTDKSAPTPINIDDSNLETVKLNDTNEKDMTDKNNKANEASINTEKPTILERIRGYQCSVDDWAIFGGILIFILLVGIICAFTFIGRDEIVSAPVRDGKYIEAITSCGPVEGLMEDSAFAFRGIPYAVPPIGENRWRPAKIIDSIDECWNGTLKAHNSTPVCWQIYANGSVDGTEDCLKLEVITPHVRYDNPLPVVVLFGTESLTGDSPSKLRPSARYSRARDVIFVRPNFRVGVFGFLSLNALSQSVHPPTSGNYGLSDMIAVLKWIEINIVHFGGNKDSVTLFGHRAAATLVTALVTSPQAKGLFARAWVTSGAAIFPGKPLIESERMNEEYLERLQCTNASCLRAYDAEELLEMVPDTWRRTWPDLPENDENATVRHEWLVLDGEILKQHPSDIWNAEAAAPPNLVIGTTMHESHSEKLFLKHKEWTPELIRKHIEDSKIGQLGLADEALKLYNLTYPGLVSMISDIRTICPLLTMARQQPSAPFYVVTQLGGGEMPLATVDDDVQAILGRYEPKTPEQRRYVSAIQQLFYHYVSHGEMKQFDTRRRVLEIGQDALNIENYPNCDFWIKNDVVPRYAKLD